MSRYVTERSVKEWMIVLIGLPATGLLLLIIVAFIARVLGWTK